MGEQTLQQQTQIAKLQKNLCSLRRLANWTMEELGDRIGVTKQTISNLENPSKKRTMTLTQYLAIRSVLDYEAAQRLEKDMSDTMLLLSIRKILDEDLDENALVKAEEDVALLASVVAGGTSGEKVQKLANERLSGSDTNILSSITQGATVDNTLEGVTGKLSILPVVLGRGVAGYLEKLFSNSKSDNFKENNIKKKRQG